MANVETLILENPDQQVEASRQLETLRLQRQRESQQAATNKLKLQMTTSQPAADQALAALRKSPASANPYIRAILLVNNILNRLLGRPPDSAESLTMLAKVLASIIIINLIISTFFLFSAIFIAAYIYSHPVEVGELAIYSAWCWLSQLFNHPCGAI